MNEPCSGFVPFAWAILFSIFASGCLCSLLRLLDLNWNRLIARTRIIVNQEELFIVIFNLRINLVFSGKNLTKKTRCRDFAIRCLSWNSILLGIEQVFRSYVLQRRNCNCCRRRPQLNLIYLCWIALLVLDWSSSGWQLGFRINF
jgi:hypothetical protein